MAGPSRAPASSGPRIDGAAWVGPVAVLVPVKAFREAKIRLAPALAADDRAQLAKVMAGAVVAAAHPLPVAVVCDDVEVAQWAREAAALVIWEPGRGLNGAVEAGVSQLRHAGVRQVVVAHADLPNATGLAALTGREGVVLVPDRMRDGTNVIVVPADSGFRFSYGPGSFARHVLEAARIGQPVEVIDDPLLAFDVDWPADLITLANQRADAR